jgi:hypothetical protein
MGAIVEWMPSWLRRVAGSTPHSRPIRATWKIVRIKEDAIPEDLNIRDEKERTRFFGVVVSTDDFLAKTQSILYCPIVDAHDKQTNHLKTVQPWHVTFESADRDKASDIPYARALVSTKMFFVATMSEIDGVERGSVGQRSREEIAERLRHWFALRA